MSGKEVMTTVQRYNQHCQSVIGKAETLAFETFESRIKHLETLIKGPKYGPDRVLQYGAGGDGDFTLPNNEDLANMIAVVKPLIRQQEDDYNLIKLWLTFLRPTRFNAHPLGNSIKSRVNNEMAENAQNVKKYLVMTARYFQTRARTMYQIVTQPDRTSFRSTIIDLDEMEFYNARTILREIHRSYLDIQRFLIRNRKATDQMRATLTSSAPHTPGK